MSEHSLPHTIGLPQPNTSPIPNIVFDHWMGILSPAEFKVLCCICRKTYGWHKGADMISLKQIEKATGLHKSSVIRSLLSLEDLQLIIKHRSKTADGDDAPNLYEIHVTDHDPMDLKGGGSRIMRPQVVASSDYRVVASCDTQKKDITKERLTKEEGGACAPPTPSASSINPKAKERAQHVHTTEDEHERLVKDFGEQTTNAAYLELSQWKERTPKNKWKKGDNLSIRKWVINALKENEIRSQKLGTTAAQYSDSDVNRKLAQTAEARLAEACRAKSLRLEALSKEVTLTTGGAIPKTVAIPYTKPGFKDEFLGLLKSWGLINQPTVA